MPLLFQDLRYAIRSLRKAPGFTAVALATLALGIGANTAVFSVVNTVLLRPLPYTDADRIVMLSEVRPARGPGRGGVSAPDFNDWRRLAKSFSSIALHGTTTLSISAPGDPERVAGARVTAGFLESLGTVPLMGRWFTRNDEQAGKEPIAILTYGLWQRRFGGDAAILGKTIGIDGMSSRIIAILPRDFRFPFAADCDLIVPIRFRPEQLQFRGIHPYRGIGRLHPGTTLEAARAEMALISKDLEKQYPDTNTGHAGDIIPLHEELSWRVAPALYVLLGAVGLVVLIACANVANLLLARALARQREMAVRAALGCSRWGLIRQAFLESAVLSFGGALAGVLLASWSLDLLKSGFFQRISLFSRAGLDTVSIDWRVLGFTLGIVVLSALISSAAPAAAISWVRLDGAIRAGGRGLTGTRGSLRSVLVAAEVALSLVLLTGAGLLGKSFLALLNVHPGFQADHVLTAGLSLPAVQYRTTQQTTAFYGTLIERVRALPGVSAAAVTDTLPLSGDDNSTGVELYGRVRKPGERWNLHPRLISADYLQTMRIEPTEGRLLTERDTASPNRVAVVSENAARQYWPGETAIGKRFAFFTDRGPWYEIVGVVPAVRNLSLDAEASADVYVPLAQNPFPFAPTAVSLVVRTGQDPAGLAREVRGIIAALDRSLPIANIRAMEEYVEASVAPRQFNLVLLAALAGIALALAAAGLYGVMACLVTQRTGEIGIRVALGARRTDVFRLIVGKGLVLAGAGVAIGLTASLAAARVMETMLYGVRPRDPVIFTAVPAVLIAVAALASYLPARRASNVDPMAALRMD